MKLAFYKYKYGNWKDYLIAKATSSKYSHVELILNNNISVSSSPRDGGVRFKKIVYVPERWDFIDLGIKEVNIDNSLLKYGYDWEAIFLHKFGLNAYEKITCSDLVFYLLTGKIEFQTPETIYNLAKSGYFNDK